MADGTNKANQRQNRANKAHYEAHARKLAAKKARRKVIRDKKVKARVESLGPCNGKRRRNPVLSEATIARRQRRTAKRLERGRRVKAAAQAQTPVAEAKA